MASALAIDRHAEAWPVAGDAYHAVAVHRPFGRHDVAMPVEVVDGLGNGVTAHAAGLDVHDPSTAQLDHVLRAAEAGDGFIEAERRLHPTLERGMAYEVIVANRLLQHDQPEASRWMSRALLSLLTAAASDCSTAPRRAGEDTCYRHTSHRPLGILRPAPD